MHAAVDAPARALDLRMARMADEDQLQAAAGVAPGLLVHLRHQGAGGIDDTQVPRAACLFHEFRDTVGAEDQDAAVGDFAQLVDEAYAAAAQVLKHMAVVDDLVQDEDRCTPDGQGAFDDLDGAVDAGAKAPRRGQVGLAGRVHQWGASWTALRFQSGISTTSSAQEPSGTA